MFGLAACEAEVERPLVDGPGKPPQDGGLIATAMKHRVAMSFLALGTAGVEPVAVYDGSFIDTNVPGLVALMNGLGALIGEG